MQIASKSHDLVPKASKSCLCLRGFAQFFFTSSSREEEQKMRRIFVTDIFRARAQKRSCLMWHSLSALLLACSHILFFCPKNLNFTYHTSLFIHFQKVWQPILWRGKGLQPLPQSASPILGHVPQLLKHAKKVIFPHQMYFSADLCYQIEIIITYLFLLKKFVLIWNRTIGFIFYSYRWIWPIFFGSP